jgi:hypothetical protein
MTTSGACRLIKNYIALRKPEGSWRINVFLMVRACCGPAQCLSHTFSDWGVDSAWWQDVLLFGYK